METNGPGVNHVPAGAGETVWLLGDLYTIKATSEATGGSYGAWETVAPPGSGPPPHRHQHQDEIFYILEGALEFWSATTG